MLAEASRDRRTVRVVGGMTKSYIGDAGDTDTEVRTSGLAGIVDHVPADLTVTVVGGTRMADLADALARAGQFLPLDPPHADHATIGGIIAANSNGFWRARYGGVRDLLIGTRIALPDGTVARSRATASSRPSLAVPTRSPRPARSRVRHPAPKGSPSNARLAMIGD
ncbi:MAG: FAD-dependent oxidoreductase [Chloroflexi bacterium]|nr:MAG: FAD-dependent oxidoreductase [Chloroflexota bacterium]